MAIVKVDNQMDNTPISHSMKRFILEHFPSSRRRTLENTDPLLESGLIDSMGVLDLVAFIEAEFKVTVDDEELTPDNFQNIARIAAFVEKKRNGSS
jgi:acyl carrier protein